jgi:hypothetical protein
VRERLGLGLDADAFPEGYAVFDFGGGGFGFGVIPGGVFVLHAVDFHVVIVGGAFPGADAGVAAGLEEGFSDRVGGEILVPFDFDGGAAFCDGFTCPGGFGHLFSNALQRWWSLDRLKTYFDAVANVGLRDVLMCQ